jgi:hypothetical protein
MQSDQTSAHKTVTIPFVIEIPLTALSANYPIQVSREYVEAERAAWVKPAMV